METRAWLEVDLAAVRYNAGLIRKQTGRRLLAVIKANAYGQGAVPVARCLEGAVAGFGVAAPQEALALRQAGVPGPILVLGAVFPGDFADLAAAGVAFTVTDPSLAAALAAVAPGLPRPAVVHLKVDSGLGRLGVPPGEVRTVFERLAGCPGLSVAGIFSHLAVCPAADPAFCRRQLDVFTACLDSLGGRRRSLLAHLAASAAISNCPETYLDLVRPGLLLFGYSDGGRPAGQGFRPALALKSRVACVRRIAAGASVSYGRTFTATRPTDLAILPLGYADGYRRGLSNRASVIWQGKRLPVAGVICMDMTMVDVTGQPVRPGDTVTLMGADGAAAVDPAELAALAATNPREILTGFGAPRVSRVYRGGAAD